jgi:SulP family sulfate permease
VLDLYPVNRIDSTALHALSDLHRLLADREMGLLFSGVKGPVRDAMRKSGLVDTMGEESLFPRIQNAVDKASSLVNPYLKEDKETRRSG